MIYPHKIVPWRCTSRTSKVTRWKMNIIDRNASLPCVEARRNLPLELAIKIWRHRLGKSRMLTSPLSCTDDSGISLSRFRLDEAGGGVGGEARSTAK